MNAGCGKLVWILLLVLLSIRAAELQIVKRNRGLEVANGRIEYIRKDLLDFHVQPGRICKVEVVQNEPMYQRVGVLTPEVFDCDYLPKSIRYEHNGSPLLRKDTIKMIANILEANQTIQEVVYYDVTILNSRCDIIRLNRVALTVPTSSKISNPITRDVMGFDYDRQFDTTCQVRVERKAILNFPAHGQLVLPNNGTSPRSMNRDPEYRVVETIMHPCDDFLGMGFRYEHLSPPTPDVDYIPIHVIVKDRRSGSILQQERHWLPVTITGAFPNQPPKPSFSNMYILEVDQFVVTNLLPMTVSVMDGETPNERLIFNITRQPSQGFIAHLSDESKPINSFWQQDLQELQIAYNPPNISFSERQTFDVEFVVFDSYFLQSRPIKCLLSVRVSYTNAPRLSWNKGLTMLEGQSRKIDHDCLQVVDRDNMPQVRFTLAGGLRHGRLYVDDRPGFTFRWNDVENGVVSYRHDDTDTRKDFIIFRITDGVHSTRFKLPISILPKDDAPPFLINNILFEVEEGQTILIHRFMLEASDADSSPDFIRYNITVPPSAGEVQKRRKWERAGWAVNTFEQSDLYQGLIYYKHLGNEEFQDSFEFQLIDRNRPVRNVSPTHTVRIKVTPVDDLPPQPAPGNSLTLTVNETDVIYITSKELHFTDVEEEDSDVTFVVTTSSHRVDGSIEDGGKLIFTDDMVMLMKDPSVPILRTFTQSAVNHRKVAYMPPMEDIGIFPVDVQFIFSVSDDGGKEVEGQRFAITVLPVDNLVPSIQVTELCLNEGGSEIIAADLIQIRDEDTLPMDLKILLTKPPLVGLIKRDDEVLERGDSFSIRDVEHFRMTYTHDGSEVHKDSFELTVTDGKQNSSAVMPVNMEAVDDQLPFILNGSHSLRIPEGGSTILTPSFLSASDVDTNDDVLIFEVLVPPTHGDITMDGEAVITFKQRDITNARVSYTHTGGEVGKETIGDVATVMVADRRGQLIDSELEIGKTKDLNFLIYPVNNRPPRVALGQRVFRCIEGGVETITHQFIMASDEDTPVENLTYIVTSLPTFGYLEDVTPRPGYEKTIGRPTTSFSHQQLLSRHIRYKQSEHQGIEPTSDQFSVSVSDGEYRSAPVPFLISISPENDEEPLISIGNVTCDEGSMEPLILAIEDLDVPGDEVMITVSQPPNHGMVMDEMQMLSRFKRSSESNHNLHHLMHNMEPMREFSLDQLDHSMVLPAYMHDGSEYHSDQFELKISDGKHVTRKLLMVDVTEINDERPTVVRNRGITLDLGESRVISSIALHSTDGDTSTSEIIYELHSVPRRGNLKLKTDDVDSPWVTLVQGDVFTEYDVEMNRLKYEHASVLGSKGQDSFRFSVTDGQFTTSRQNFAVHIEHTKKSMVHVITHPLHVNEGQKAFVTTDVLVSRDDSERPQEITYDVIRLPTHGHLEYVTYPNVPIEMFTQLDLLARNIMYAHSGKADVPFDTFRVLSSNGLKSREADVTILVTSVDAELPTLIIGEESDALNSLSTNEADLTLFSGSSVVISDSFINISDPDTAMDNLRVTLIEQPRHGALSVRGINLDGLNNVVNKIDIVRAHFLYRHNGDGAQIDRFSFTVSDGIHTGFIYKGETRRDPVVFNLKIESLDESAPRLLVNREPTSIQSRGSGRFPDYGIHLDSRVLLARDDGTTDPGDITYTVTVPPSYGLLQVTGREVADQSNLRFSQADLNHRDVIYVVSSKLHVTNDSFSFDVEDSWGNTLTDNRFAMSWSRVEMMEKKLKFCENVGSITLDVRRYGNLVTSSFAGIAVNSKSAKISVDFTPSTASQVQFDPGVSQQSWQVNIIDDGLEERKETFKAVLHTPVNTVLTPRRTSTLVVILDQSHRSCFQGAVPYKKRKSKKNKKKNGKKKRTKKGKSRKKKFNLVNDEFLSSTKTVIVQSPRASLDVKNTVLDITRGETSSKKVKYGKLGPGVTVSPATYFRNKTTRIWTYHGILSATVDEADEESIGVPLEGATSRLGTLTGIPLRGSRDKDANLGGESDELNDDPSVSTTNRGTLYEGELKVGNSDSLASIRVSGGHDSASSTPASSITQPCILSTRGTLFYDPVAKILYQCDGAQWLPWKRTTLSSRRPKPTATKVSRRCNEGWRAFENRCFYVGSADEYELSWNTAQRLCREEYSAHLVSVQSRKQLNWLWKIARKTRFWIGLNRKLNPEVWEWVSGDQVGFTNWRRNFPRGGRSQEAGDCTAVASKKRWVDTSCMFTSRDTKYICVKDP